MGGESLELPGGVVIRRADFRDVMEMARVYVDAYRASGDPATHADIYRVSLEVEPSGCLVAEMHGSIVGTACFYVYGRLAWIGAVGVVRRLQRRGIGRALMSRVLEELRGRGVETVRLDSTEAGRRLYESLGFKPDYETVAYELYQPPSCSGWVAVSESRGIPREVLDLDREAFGTDRFKALKPFLERGARILLAETLEVEGYAMVYKSRIGPVIARDSRAACFLIREAYAMGGRVVIAPSANEGAIQLLEEAGVRHASCIRMTLGRPAREKPWMIHGILNWAKG